MLKSWIRRLIFALLFISLAVCPFETGVLASQSIGSPGSSPNRQSKEVSQSNLQPGFQIVSTTANSLILDIQAPSYSFEPGKSDVQSCQTLKADGYVQSAAPGEPALLSAGVMLGIPLDVDPSIRILSIETVELPGQVRLCPAATPKMSRDLIGSPEFLEDSLAENPQAYAQDSFVPAQPYELITGGMLRSQRVARLRFMPFQYNPSRDQLRLIRHIRLEIQLGDDQAVLNTSPSGNEGPFEALLEKILINYDQARSWRAQPEPKLPALASPSDPQDDPVYKIQVSQDGLYQVTYPALQTAGVPVDTLNTLNPRTFRLLNQGVEIPIIVIGEDDGDFNPGDYILFYGQRINTRYTDTNIYWLSWGAGNGLRMAAANGTITGSATPPASYKTTLHLEENHEYISARPSGPQNDHWYWYLINASSAPASRNFTFQLTNLAVGSLTASIRGQLKGNNATPQHHTRVLLNGNLIDDQTWPSIGEHTFAKDIPQFYLNEGTNTITVECPRDGGITLDQTLVNWFEIDYYHTYSAENNLLAFGGDQPGLWEFQVGGFSSSTIDAFDITDPLAPARIVGGSVILDGPFYRLSFEQLLSGARRYLALSPSRWLAPVAINLDVPSTLRSPTNAADYIIIGHQDFLNAIQPLATYRAGQGLRVKVVDVQDVYDEYNGGVFDAQAIQSFLSYAYFNWIDPTPSYVLLVGDGHYDFKDYYGGSGPNYLPPFLGEFDPWIGETAADNRYVTVSGGDTLPDMYIGRLPANSAAETTAMVTKIMAYEQDPLQGDWNTRLTFVADNADSGGNFPVSSDAIADHSLRPEFNVEKVYYGVTHTTAAATKSAIIQAINQGRLIVHYTGHGATRFWAAEQLLHVNDISSLNNTSKYPFFVPMTCAEGYFIFPQGLNYPSLAESLMRASGKGAIASFSATGFGLSNGHDILAQGLYQALFTDGTLQFGPATTFAKVYLDANSSGYMDLLDTYTLFGDPASRLRTNPTAVLLASFTGSVLPGAVQLDWETANEVGMVGFNLYRSGTIGGVKQLLNTSLIPANHRGELQGDVYQYIDPVGPGIYYYWLELVQIGGSDLTEPIQVTSGYSVNLPVLTK